MIDFLQKKDHWSIVLFACVFMGFYFLSKEFSSNNLLVVLSVSGLGACVGYILGNWVTDKSKGTKVFLVSLFTAMFIGVLLMSGNRQNDVEKTYRYETGNLLMGKWETDDEGGFKIRLEIDQNDAIMSISPDFEEIEYDLIFSENSMQFIKSGSVKFNFSVDHIDDFSLTLSQSGEKLVFTRID